MFDAAILAVLLEICSQGSINKISTTEFLDKISPKIENASTVAENVKKISIEELKQKIESANPNLIVVNVLGERYFKDCSIDGSINWPLKNIVSLASQYCSSQNNSKTEKIIESENELLKTSDQIPQDTLEIVVYCASNECDASEKAAITLMCMGFKNVYEYSGGISEWFQKGFAHSGPCKEEYLKS